MTYLRKKKQQNLATSFTPSADLQEREPLTEKPRSTTDAETSRIADSLVQDRVCAWCLQFTQEFHNECPYCRRCTRYVKSGHGYEATICSRCCHACGPNVSQCDCGGLLRKDYDERNKALKDQIVSKFNLSTWYSMPLFEGF